MPWQDSKRHWSQHRASQHLRGCPQLLKLPAVCRLRRHQQEEEQLAPAEDEDEEEDEEESEYETDSEEEGFGRALLKPVFVPKVAGPPMQAGDLMAGLQRCAWRLQGATDGDSAVPSLGDGASGRAPALTTR